MPPVRTVPAGSVPKDSETGEDLYTITVTTNLVLVPVTVTDNQGRLVGGLLPKDFSVLESGQKQTLKFFTSDPFPLSAAVVIDTGMPDVGLKKVQETLSALQGAFSQFDEVGIYTYSSTVGRVSDFTGVGKQLTATLNQVKGYSGANNGPPVTSGPLGPQGPMINGHPLDIPVTPVTTPPKVARVLNDAILLAARDLSKRDRARRKIIFIISDGREQGSTASYKDTLKVLLTQNITVYAVGVEGAAIPVYDRLQRIHLPKTAAADGLQRHSAEIRQRHWRRHDERRVRPSRHRARIRPGDRRRAQSVHPGLFAQVGHWRLPPDRGAGAASGRKGICEGWILSSADAAIAGGELLSI